MTMNYFIIATALVIVVLVFFKVKAGDQSVNPISPEELRSKMKNDKIVLVDVRARNEMRQGVIGKPLHIELSPSMKNQMAGLDKDAEYVLYCRSGRRSLAAANIMKNLGFRNISNLSGGYNAWSKSKKS